jgi:hypothetical protein
MQRQLDPGKEDDLRERKNGELGESGFEAWERVCHGDS